MSERAPFDPTPIATRQVVRSPDGTVVALRIPDGVIEQHRLGATWVGTIVSENSPGWLGVQLLGDDEVADWERLLEGDDA